MNNQKTFDKMNSLLTSLFCSILTYLQMRKKTKARARKRKLKMINAARKSQWLIARYRKLKNSRHRSCWVKEDLLRSAGHGFWETKAPYLSGFLSKSKKFFNVYNAFIFIF